MDSIDILMATYNGEGYVAEQLKSIQQQTFQNWRLLISDDCSTDCTLEIVRSFADEDERITVASEGVRFGSAKANFMHLLSVTNAKYVMLCDQDDYWLPEKIEKTLQVILDQQCQVGSDVPLLVFSDMIVVDDNLNHLAESFERYSGLNPRRTSFAKVLAQPIGAGCTFMANRNLVDYSIRCSDYDSMVMHDWWLSIVAAAFGSIRYVNETLTLYRQHGNNVVGARRFSVLKWIGKLDEMKDRQKLIARQAGCFSQTYFTVCDRDVLRAALDCENTVSANGISNLAHLFASGAWKPGIRKAGQILAVLR